MVMRRCDGAAAARSARDSQSTPVAQLRAPVVVAPAAVRGPAVAFVERARQPVGLERPQHRALVPGGAQDADGVLEQRAPHARPLRGGIDVDRVDLSRAGLAVAVGARAHEAREAAVLVEDERVVALGAAQPVAPDLEALGHAGHGVWVGELAVGVMPGAHLQGRQRLGVGQARPADHAPVGSAAPAPGAIYSRCSRPTSGEDGRSATRRTASSTPGTNDVRSVESWRMVSVWPTSPRMTSWWATRPGRRTEWMGTSPSISSAVRAAVPLGASSLPSWCSSMTSALAM